MKIRMVWVLEEEEGVRKEERNGRKEGKMKWRKGCRKKGRKRRND